MVKLRILDRREFCDGLTKKLPDLSIAEFLVGALGFEPRTSCTPCCHACQGRNVFLRPLVSMVSVQNSVG